MGLTSTPFLLLLIALLVASTVAAIGGLPRLGRDGVVKRAVLVLLAQFSALLVVAAMLNDWGEFYGSWTDLLGTGGTQIVTNGGTSAAAAGLTSAGHTGLPKGLALQPWSTRNELARRGGIFRMPLPGRATGLSTTALVYLPPQYFQERYRTTRFPVVETFTGFPGDVPQLITRMGYPGVLLTRLQAGRAKPMILVLMSPTLVPPRDTECTDVPGGPQVLSFLSRDVPADLEAALWTTPDGWGAMGHSTGGYCAVKLAMTDPSRFTTAVSISGYYHAISDVMTGDLWGGSLGRKDANDPDWLLQHRPVPPVAVLATIGGAEYGADGITGSREFIRLTRPPMTSRLLVVKDGGHNFGDYQKVLPAAFDWLSAHLRPPTT